MTQFSISEPVVYFSAPARKMALDWPNRKLGKCAMLFTPEAPPAMLNVFAADQPVGDAFDIGTCQRRPTGEFLHYPRNNR